MVSVIQVGTDDGLFVLGAESGGKSADQPSEPTALRGHQVNALVSEGDSIWALVGGYTIYCTGSSGFWRMTTRLGGKRSKLPRQTTPPAGTCLHPDAGGLLIGTTGAHLVQLDEDDDPVRVEQFDEVSGRGGWHTPWGAPPDVRSISGDGRGTIYVNVHVGGIPKSSDGGKTWIPTIDVDADVHQVYAVPGTSRVLAATARGLATSKDGGMRWSYRDDGLTGPYCRAVALSGTADQEVLVVSASIGPSGEKAGVFRSVDGGGFERCAKGLPESFDTNIDTHCLTAAGTTVVFATSDGAVYVSRDSGESWTTAATGLPQVRCLLPA